MIVLIHHNMLMSSLVDAYSGVFGVVTSRSAMPKPTTQLLSLNHPQRRQQQQQRHTWPSCRQPRPHRQNNYNNNNNNSNNIQRHFWKSSSFMVSKMAVTDDDSTSASIVNDEKIAAMVSGEELELALADMTMPLVVDAYATWYVSVVVFSASPKNRYQKCFCFFTCFFSGRTTPTAPLNGKDSQRLGAPMLLSSTLTRFMLLLLFIYIIYIYRYIYIFIS
jgi:hypothetical protein